MTLFPLAKPLNGLDLTTTACHLYRRSLVRILPLSITFALLIHLFQDGHRYFPADMQDSFHSFSMFLIVLSLPILAGYIVVIDYVSKRKAFTYQDIFIRIGEGFIGLMATLVSMLLIPAIIFAVATGIYLLLLQAHLSLINIYIYRTLVCLIVFLAFTSKIYAPVLIFTDNLDANSALDVSNDLVRGNFWKTFLYGLYGTLFFVGLLTFSSWLPWIIPTTRSMPLTINIIGQMLVALFSSWSFAFWLTLLANRSALR